MKRARKPATVCYTDLRELVFHASETFPETRFFPSGDAAMPDVTGRERNAFTGALGAWAERRGLLGKHIAILGPNGAAWISCFFAALGGGCVAVPLHLGTKTDELISCARRSDSAVLLFDEGSRADA